MGESVAPKEVGEIWFRHPAVMTGYDGDPPRGDNWIASGDRMKVFDDGDIQYVGRAEHITKRGGENISFQAIERALIEHPLYEEVVVVPDRVHIDEACAVILWRDSQPHVAELRR